MTTQRSYQDNEVRTWNAQQYFNDEVLFKEDLYTKKHPFNVKAYGATGDGTTDDAAAIQAADTACATAGGGIVSFPPGTYLCSQGIERGLNVSWMGAGASCTTIKASAAGAYLVTVRESGATANTYTQTQGLKFDGNDLAERCFDMGVCTEHLMVSCRMEHALDAGLVLRGTQNSTFINVFCEHCGDATATNGGGIRLNHGASNNLFLRPQINECRQRGIVLCHSDTIDDEPDAAWATEINIVPGNNRFIGGIAERDVAATVSQIYIRGGNYTMFSDMALQIGANKVLIEMDNTDSAPLLNQFRNCTSYGTSATGTTIYKSRGAYKTQFNSCQLNSNTAFDLDDTDSSVQLIGTNTLTYIVLFTTTGSYVQDQLLKGETQAGIATFDREVTLSGALNHDGTTVGFYGTAPIVQAVLATGAGKTVDEVITALQNLGLVKQS